VISFAALREPLHEASLRRRKVDRRPSELDGYRASCDFW
jgi:hypothetical protein